MTGEQFKKNVKEKEESERLRTIFSEEEIHGTVKAFVLAYLRGQIDVGFPNAEEYINEQKRKGKKFTYEEAIDKEISGKQAFLTNMNIMSGTIQSTEEELEKATHSMFSDILGLRAGHRIKGTFMEFEIEQKLDDLEVKLNATNHVVEQLVAWLIEEEKADDKMP